MPKKSDREPREEDGDDEDLPPLPKRKGKFGKVLLILGIVGFVVFAAAATGAYLLFFNEPGTSAEHKVQPKRELPMEVFAYRPSDQSKIEFYNAAVIRDKGLNEKHFPYLAAFMPQGHFAEFDKVSSVCRMEDPDNKLPKVLVATYLNETPIASIAAACRLKEMPGAPRGRFGGRDASGTWVVFQTSPKQIVFVGTRDKTDIPLEEMAKIADRTPESNPLPAPVREGLEIVSGYSRITATLAANGPVKLRFQGDNYEKGGIREEFVMEVHSSAQEAKDKVKKEHAFRTKVGVAGKKPGSETNYWRRGEKYFWWGRIP